MKKILFLGPKSPPVTGYANIVNALAKYLNIQGYNVTYLSTVPNFLSKFFPSKTWKLFRLFYLVMIIPITVILIPFNSTVYLNINGGLAQIFDVLVAMISQLFRKKIILHHNSYSYINNKSKLAKLLFIIVGKNAYHIVNCQDMKNKITSIYPVIMNIETVSNVSILAESDKKIKRDIIQNQKSNNPKLIIGFMGYYNQEKGIDLFASTIKKVTDLKQKSLYGVAVGPTHDEVLMNELRRKFHDIIDFRPPAYGEDKEKFFEEIDILLFPSKYTNEAEPLTIHHALEVGVPVISTDIGCLKDVMNHFNSCSSLSIAKFVDDSVKLLYTFSHKTLEERFVIKNNLKDEYKKYSIQNSEHLKYTMKKILE